jgi:hypothetical protein
VQPFHKIFSKKIQLIDFLMVLSVNYMTGLTKFGLGFHFFSRKMFKRTYDNKSNTYLLFTDNFVVQYYPWDHVL